jgi:hypothetical protein
MFLEEISCSVHFRKKDYRERKKKYHSYNTGTWIVRPLIEEVNSKT